MTWREALHPRGPDGRFVDINWGQLARDLTDRYPAVVHLTRHEAGHVTVDHIELPPGRRNQGIGSQIMKEITDAADASGTTLSLSPSSDFGASITRLRRFYQKQGFRANAGRGRDYSIPESMFRLPRQEPDWVARASSRIGDRESSRHYDYQPGTDQMGWWLQHSAAKAAGSDASDDNGDGHLNEIVDRQGWGAPGRVGAPTDLDRAVADGGTEIWRGVRGQMPGGVWEWGPKKGQPLSVPPDQTPAAWLARLRTGPTRMGFGLYGNGNYFSTDRRAADAYGTHTAAGAEYSQGLYEEVWDAGGWLSHPESIQRAVLHPGARVIDHAELKELVAAQIRAARESGAGVRARTFADEGRIAAALGYDVVRVPPGHDDGSGLNAEQWVILNRTALLFEEPQ